MRSCAVGTHMRHLSRCAVGKPVQRMSCCAVGKHVQHMSRCAVGMRVQRMGSCTMLPGEHARCCGVCVAGREDSGHSVKTSGYTELVTERTFQGPRLSQIRDSLTRIAWRLSQIFSGITTSKTNQGRGRAHQNVWTFAYPQVGEIAECRRDGPLDGVVIEEYLTRRHHVAQACRNSACAESKKEGDERSCGAA